MINHQKLEKTMHELGFAERHAGTGAVRAGVEMVEATRHIAMTKEIYPGIAAAMGAASWRTIERNMRHAISSAHESCAELWGIFMGGCTPTNGEVLLRLARVCRE